MAIEARPDTTENLERFKDLLDRQIEGVTSRAARLGTPEGPSVLDYNLAENPSDRIDRIGRVLRERLILTTEIVPIMAAKREEIGKELVEARRVTYRQQVREELNFDFIEAGRNDGLLTEEEYILALTDLEEVVNERLSADFGVSVEPAPVPAPVQPVEGPTPNGHLELPGPHEPEVPTYFIVPFPNGKNINVDNEDDAKLLRVISEHAREREIPQDILIVARYGMFDFEKADLTRGRIGELSPQLLDAGYKIAWERRRTESNPRLRNIYTVDEVIASPSTEEIKPSGLSERELMLNSLNSFLDSPNLTPAEMISLVKEVLVLKGKPATVHEAASQITDTLRNIYSNLGRDEVTKVELEFWQKLVSASGQSDNLGARQYFEQKMREWFEVQRKAAAQETRGETKKDKLPMVRVTLDTRKVQIGDLVEAEVKSDLDWDVLNIFLTFPNRNLTEYSNLFQAVAKKHQFIHLTEVIDSINYLRNALKIGEVSVIEELTRRGRVYGWRLNAQVATIQETVPGAAKQPASAPEVKIGPKLQEVKMPDGVVYLCSGAEKARIIRALIPNYSNSTTYVELAKNIYGEDVKHGLVSAHINNILKDPNLEKSGWRINIDKSGGRGHYKVSLEKIGERKEPKLIDLIEEDAIEVARALIETAEDPRINLKVYENLLEMAKKIVGRAKLDSDGNEQARRLVALEKTGFIFKSQNIDELIIQITDSEISEFLEYLYLFDQELEEGMLVRILSADPENFPEELKRFITAIPTPGDEDEEEEALKAPEDGQPDSSQAPPVPTDPARPPILDRPRAGLNETDENYPYLRDKIDGFLDELASRKISSRGINGGQLGSMFPRLSRVLDRAKSQRLFRGGPRGGGNGLFKERHIVLLMVMSAERNLPINRGMAEEIMEIINYRILLREAKK